MRARWMTRAALVIAVATLLTACAPQEPEPVSWLAGAETPAESVAPQPRGSQAIGAAPTPTATPQPEATQTPVASPAPPQSPPPPAPPQSQTEPEPEDVPPPPPPRYEGECIAEYAGPARSPADVAAVLRDAAARTYWPLSAPHLRVPEKLVRATAWQESGWQTNVIACDGGVGLMQVMPDTATWMNDRFGQSYDMHVYTDNAYLGATYLAWLIKYLGDMHFGGAYELNAADCADHRDPCLLNLVISAYNVGPGPAEQRNIPNPRYVENVRALMTMCECLSF